MPCLCFPLSVHCFPHGTLPLAPTVLTTQPLLCVSTTTSPLSGSNCTPFSLLLSCLPPPPPPPPLVQQLVHNSAALLLASVPPACDFGKCTLATAAAAGFPPFRVVPLNSSNLPPPPPHTAATATATAVPPTMGCHNGECAWGLPLSPFSPLASSWLASGSSGAAASMRRYQLWGQAQCLPGERTEKLKLGKIITKLCA